MGIVTGEDRLKKMIRNVSRLRLEGQVPGKKVAVMNLAERPLVCSHWMVMISLSGPTAKIMIKTHFKTRDAQALAAPLYGINIDKISRDQSIDCMREFCNLIAGGVKETLVNRLELHTSLPVFSRGFDEVFFREFELPTTVFDYWRLAFGDDEFICTLSMEFQEPVDLSNLNVEPNLTRTEGTVEYL